MSVWGRGAPDTVIARVHFNGIIVKNGKELELPDYCDIHVATIHQAEEIFKYWIEKQYSIRGAKSGIWHPAGKYGTVELVSVEVKPKKKAED
jgi:hypothetical protein